MEIGHVGENVVGHDEIGLAALGHDPCGERGVEKLCDRLDSSFAGDRGDVDGRLDPEGRDAGAGEVLEQVAVVAGGLDHEAVRAEGQLCDHRRRESARMLEERIRVGREVRIGPEERVRRNALGDLDERAAGAADDVEGVARLDRRLTRLDERVDERNSPSESTGSTSCAPHALHANPWPIIVSRPGRSRDLPGRCGTTRSSGAGPPRSQRTATSRAARAPGGVEVLILDLRDGARLDHRFEPWSRLGQDGVDDLAHRERPAVGDVDGLASQPPGEHGLSEQKVGLDRVLDVHVVP